jgi:PAS domain-containing protein
MASLSEQHAVAAPSFGTSALSLDASPVAIALTDLSGRIEHANRAFQKLFGLSPAISVLHPDVMTVCVGCADLSFLDAVARDGRLRQIEMTMRLPSGRAKRLLCSASRVDGEIGTPKWLSLSFVDVSVSEADSAHHDCEFDSVLIEKLAHVGSWRMIVECPQDLTRNMMSWSPALCAFLNTRPSESEHGVQQYLAAVHPDDRARVLMAMRATISSNVDYIVEFRRAGTARVIRSRGTLIRAAAPGSPLILAGIDQDVTHDYQHEQQQRREALVLKSLIESCETPVFAVDRQLSLLTFNRAYLETLSEKDRREVGVGADVLASIGNAFRRKRTAENLRHALQGERRVEELRTHDRSQASMRREIVYSPMLGLSREVIGVAVFQRELPEVAHIKHAPLRSWRRQEWFEPLQAAVALSAARK